MFKIISKIPNRQRTHPAIYVTLGLCWIFIRPNSIDSISHFIGPCSEQSLEYYNDSYWFSNFNWYLPILARTYINLTFDVRPTRIQSQTLVQVFVKGVFSFVKWLNSCKHETISQRQNTNNSTCFFVFIQLLVY